VNSLEDNLQKEVQEIIKKEEILLGFIERILKIKFNARKIRIHGNYNLKQVLFTGKDFVITNFEGQSSVPFTERKLKRSPLRDVSSLIFSFHTLANSRLSKQTSFSSEEFSTAEHFANQWWLSASRLLLTKYFKTISSDKNNTILQAEKEDLDYLLLVYLFEKVLVDLSHGLNVNGGWIELKLKALNQLFDHTENFKVSADNIP
jgi:maltose alpha-D-glucosyltransferase/alpha-amylase